MKLNIEFTCLPLYRKC